MLQTGVPPSAARPNVEKLALGTGDNAKTPPCTKLKPGFWTATALFVVVTLSTAPACTPAAANDRLLGLHLRHGQQRRFLAGGGLRRGTPSHGERQAQSGVLFLKRLLGRSELAQHSA